MNAVYRHVQNHTSHITPGLLAGGGRGGCAHITLAAVVKKLYNLPIHYNISAPAIEVLFVVQRLSISSTLQADSLRACHGECFLLVHVRLQQKQTFTS